MASTEENRAFLRDVELGNRPTPTADPHAPPTVLEHARSGNLDQFRAELDSHDNSLLNFKAGPDVYFNRTPLHLAAMEGHEKIVEFILSRPEISREVVNAKDCFGYTPLHLAVRHAQETIVRLLTMSSWVLPDRFLAVTCEPDDLGEHYGGFTPLHFAAVGEHVAIAKLLLRQPCQVEFAYDPVNLHAMTWEGRTPLEVAQKQYSLSHSKEKAQRQNCLTLVKLLALSDSNWLQQYRERAGMSLNAILVGSALVVAASFGSWLQPPGGIPVPNSGAPSPSPSAFPNAETQWNSVFYSYLAFAFTLSIAALLIGTWATLPSLELTLEDDMQRLQGAVENAQVCLLLSVLCLLTCFSFAGSIVLHDFAAIYGTSAYYVVILLPILGFVYVAYFVVSSSLNFRPDYGWKKRLSLVCIALSYGFLFTIFRFKYK